VQAGAANPQQNSGGGGSGGSSGGGGSAAAAKAKAAADYDDFDNDDEYDIVDETAANSSPSGEGGDEAGQQQQQQHIIGPTGDFVTAPEVSSIFTETLGIWLYTQHQLLAKSPLKKKQKESSSPASNETSKPEESSSKPKQSSTAWQWLECGPGAGTLTVDMISFAQQLPDFGSSLEQVHLVEASPVLRRVQKERLQSIETSAEITFRFDGDDDVVVKDDEKQSDTDSKDDATATADKKENKNTIAVCWHDSLAAFQAWQVDHDVSLPIFTVWQEFLDALPVYAFEKTAKDGWRERMVDVVVRPEFMDEEDLKKEQEALTKNPALANVKKPRFRLVLAPEVTPALKTLLQVDEQGNLPNKELDSAPVGSVIEVNPEAILVAQDLAKLLEKQGGAGLIIDYGQDGSTDSIRAFRKHQQVHFLSRPGQVDVTADVDFAAIRHAINALGGQSQGSGDSGGGSSSSVPEVQAFGPTTQGQFLMAMGIQERVIQLIESDHTTEEEAENLFEALKRLVGPEEMGSRYKVLAIARKKEGIFEPPGFDYLNRPK
jgi:NADH dehydrogenase [ubiquinone] 1 alpha subcomplex assembly factor 7